MTEQVNPDTGEVVNAGLRHVPKEIIKARIAVMKDAYGVGKTGKNTFHNYDYASDYDVLSLVQPSMAKNGLMLEMWPDDVVGPDENGNMWVRFMMQWQHESGACSEPTPWWGVAQDRDRQGRMGDKWFNKAATAAEKYFLLKQFHIPAGKDVDPDKAAQEANPPYQGQAAQPQQTHRARTKAGSNGNGATQQQIAIEVPETPALIKVPSSDNMADVWRKWAEALANTLSNAQSVDEVNAWMTENRSPLGSLKAFSATGAKWAAHLEDRAEQKRHELAQAPTPEPAGPDVGDGQNTPGQEDAA